MTTSKLEVLLLGAVRFEIDGVVVDVSPRKAEGLLIYLAATNRPIPRNTLATLFWPEDDNKRAKVSLRRALADIKKAIGGDWLDVDRRAAQLNSQAAIQVDVQRFRSHLANEPHTVETLTEAINLYRADFLTGFSLKGCLAFDEWQLFEQESLRRLFATALESLIALYQARGEFSAAIPHARRFVALDPLNESAQQQLIQLYIQDGQLSAALQQYEVCKQVLEEELGVEPTAETSALLEQLEYVGRERPNNLPALEARAFIGRKAEIVAIQQRLADPKTKLLTLVGMGGTGKTTLALQFSARAVQHSEPLFADGIFFISLAAVWQGKDVISATRLITMLADALALSLSTTTSPKQQLFAVLRPKSYLLIIDNGESLGKEGRRLLSEMMGVAPNVKFLVTSRERFHLREEWILEVGGLAFSVDQQQDAHHLFEERAKQVAPTFAVEHLDQAEQDALAELCRLTQGVPLALELAAAWTHLLSCQQIVKEIKARLDALSTHQLDVEARHRSMRAVFDQSWDRLENDEQALLECLAIFVNTFDYEAASRVADASLSGLSKLQAKSLLQIITHNTSRRFKLHPLLRQFILENSNVERLTYLGERHAAYYGDFMQSQEPRLATDAMTVALDSIQANIDDVQAGWQWAIEHEALELLHQYHYSIVRFYLWRGWWHAGLEELLPLLQIKPSLEDSLRKLSSKHLAIWTELVTIVGQISIYTGSLAQAEALLQESRQMAHVTENPSQLAVVYKLLGLVAQRRGEQTEAEALLKFSLQVSADSTDFKLLANTLMALGGTAKDNGELAKAQTYLGQSLEIYRRSAYVWGEIHSQRLLGEVIAMQGEIEAGITYIAQSLQLSQEAQDDTAVALAHLRLGQIHIARQQYAFASNHLEQSSKIFQDIKDTRGIALVRKSQANLSAQLGARTLARSQYQESFEQAIRFRDLPLVLDILLEIARFSARVSVDRSMEYGLGKLLSTVHNHPASNARQKIVVSQLSQQLPPPAHKFKSDRPLSLLEIERIVANLLTESQWSSHE